MTIRPAHPADLDHLARLFNDYRIWYGKPADLDAARAFLAERLERNQSVILLAEANAPVGFAQLYPSFSSLSLAPVWILNDLYVDASHRAAGFGRALVNACIDHARTTNAASLTLETVPDNTPAIALYESLGFTRDDAFLHYAIAT